MTTKQAAEIDFTKIKIKRLTDYFDVGDAEVSRCKERGIEDIVTSV